MMKVLYPLCSVFMVCAVARAQYPNVQISSDSLSAFQPNEVSIAINPQNPLELAVGSNPPIATRVWYFHSTDGGLTWHPFEFQTKTGGYGDPSLTFDNDGHLFYVTLGGPALGVLRSSDGVAFDTGSPIGASDWPQLQDKPTIAADRRTGSSLLAVTWTRFDTYQSRKLSDSSRILCSVSADHGLHWSNPVRLDERAGDCTDSSLTAEGAVPAFGLNGEIYVVWSARDSIFFTQSLDTGKTFSAERAIATQPAGWWVPAKNIGRANGFPVIVCDQNSANKGRIYVSWGAVVDGKPHVFFITSIDGTHWSDPLDLTVADTARHLFPALTVDQVTGDIHILYYAIRAGDSTDVFLATSNDAGANFTTRKISQRSFVASTFLGDYISVAAHAGSVYPVWTRSKSNTTTLWAAMVSMSSTVAIDQQNELHMYIGGNGTLHFMPASGEAGRLVIFDVLGRATYRSNYDAGMNDLSVSGLQTGFYLASVFWGGRTSTLKFVY